MVARAKNREKKKHFKRQDKYMNHLTSEKNLNFLAHLSYA